LILKKRTYLKENRLADVIALIQVLAFDKFYRRTVKALNDELQGKPKSANSWNELAIEHPEFFRVIVIKDDDEETATPKISLISRHVKLSNEERLTDTLSPDLAKKFFETAIQLHDIQKERSRKYLTWLPLLVAIIPTIFSIWANFRIQKENSLIQDELKRFEIELKPKQESYASFMRNIGKAYYSAHTHNIVEYAKALEDGEGAFFTFEPFLSTSERIHFWNEYQQFIGLCSDMTLKDTSKINNDQVFKSFEFHKNHFRTHLYSALFDSTYVKRSKTVNCKKP
jgi:hypothetical protein